MHIRLLFLFSLLVISSTVLSQSNYSDTLWAKWKDENQNDTLRIYDLDRFIYKYYLFNHPDSAFILAQKGIEFVNEKKIYKYESVPLSLQGTSFFIKGDYQNAQKYYTKSLNVCLKYNHKRLAAKEYGRIGNIYNATGDYEKALEYYQKSLKMKLEMNDTRSITFSYGSIAIVYDAMGDYIRSLEYYQLALKNFEELGDLRGASTILNNIGLVYYHQGFNDKALESFQKSLKIRSETKDNNGISSSISNIGLIYSEINDTTNALELYKKSLLIAEETGNKKNISATLNLIGNVYLKNKEYNKAINFYFQSLKITESMGDQDAIAVDNYAIGLAYLNQKKYNSAIEFSKKCFDYAIANKSVVNLSSSLNVLYEAHLKTKNNDSSYYFIKEQKKLSDQTIKTNYFSLSENEKEMFFKSMKRNYDDYFDFSLSFHSNYPSLTDSSYNIAIRTKGLSMKSSTAMRKTIHNSNDSILISQYNNWLSLKKNIAKLYASGEDFKKSQNIADSLEKVLIKGSNEFNNYHQLQKLDWKQIKASLKKDECAIEFIHFKSKIDSLMPIKYAALIITSKSEHPEMISIFEEKDLMSLLKKYHVNDIDYINQLYGNKEEFNAELYNLIWKPLESHLTNIKSIFYSPSGLLHKISFSALSLKKDLYLCDNFSLNQLSSTGSIVFYKPNILEKTDRYFLMGGINYNSKTTSEKIWNYLPGTLEEVNEISSLLSKRKFKYEIFSSDSATEELLKTKISNADIAHLSTHGFFFPDPTSKNNLDTNVSVSEVKFRGVTNYANWSFVTNKNPLMRSGLVLAHANDIWERNPLAAGDDGVLTAQEVSNLDLNHLKLVVLSACETGLGDIKGSEGVYGLQRAFKIAGARNIIMSLWQVPDKETEEFMTTFYNELIKTKEIRKSFANAQKAMRKKYDPYFWAAFVLIE